MERRGRGTNERIAVGSGERESETRGVRARGWWKCARGGSVKEKRVARGVRPVGRYFCACFVFNFSPPFARRGADAAPLYSAPRRAAPLRAIPRHAAPRRRAEEPWRAGWCAVVLVRMHISVPHILIQGVITRLSSAHSHHCLNHPPPPSSSSRQFPSPRGPVPLPTALLHLLHLQPPSSFCGSPSPTQPPRLSCTNLYYPPAGRIFLQTGPSISLSSPSPRLSNSSDTQVSSLFPLSILSLPPSPLPYTFRA